MTLPKIYVDYAGFGRIEINFDPIIKNWRFLNNNGDELISELYRDITVNFVYRAIDEQLKTALKNHIISKLKVWEMQGNVLFPTEITIECEKW